MAQNYRLVLILIIIAALLALVVFAVRLSLKAPSQTSQTRQETLQPQQAKNEAIIAQSEIMQRKFARAKDSIVVPISRTKNYVITYNRTTHFFEVSSYPPEKATVVRESVENYFRAFGFDPKQLEIAYHAGGNTSDTTTP